MEPLSHWAIWSLSHLNNGPNDSMNQWLNGSIQKIFEAKLLKDFQRLAPVFGDAAWISALDDRIQNCLISQDVVHALDLEILGIKPIERRRQLNPKLRRI